MTKQYAEMKAVLFVGYKWKLYHTSIQNEQKCMDHSLKAKQCWSCHQVAQTRRTFYKKKAAFWHPYEPSNEDVNNSICILKHW